MVFENAHNVTLHYYTLRCSPHSDDASPYERERSSWKCTSGLTPVCERDEAVGESVNLATLSECVGGVYL
jgi:hypothetical protein